MQAIDHIIEGPDTFATGMRGTTDGNGDDGTRQDKPGVGTDIEIPSHPNPEHDQYQQRNGPHQPESAEMTMRNHFQCIGPGLKKRDIHQIRRAETQHQNGGHQQNSQGGINQTPQAIG